MYNNKIIIFELPEGDRIGSCAFNKEQQERFAEDWKLKGKQLLEENGGVLILPSNVKVKVLDL